MRRRRIDYRKFIRFLVLLLLIAVLIVVAVVSCIRLSGHTLRVGISESSIPLAYTNDRNEAAGFEVEYAKLLAETLEENAEIKFIAPDEMPESLENGTVDIVVSVRQSVHDYISEFDETSPMIAYGLVITKSAGDESVAGAEDLRGKRVGVIAESDAELLCEELILETPFNLRLYDYEVQPFQDLKLKKNDVVISDELYALYMQTTDPDSYEVLNTLYNGKGYGVRLSDKLNSDRSSAIRNAVDDLAAAQATDELFLYWFGMNLGTV